MKLFILAGRGAFSALQPSAQVDAVVEAVRDLDGGHGTSEVSFRDVTLSSSPLPPAGDATGSSPLDGLEVPTHIITVRLPEAAEDGRRRALTTLTDLAPDSRTFAVDELVAFSADDAPLPELSRIGLLVRPKDKTSDEFWRHWTERHVPLVLAQGPLFSRYVTNLVVEPEQPWDGVVEQWFTGKATWAEHDRQIREEKPEVAADISRFIGRFAQFEAVERTSVRV